MSDKKNFINRLRAGGFSISVDSEECGDSESDSDEQSAEYIVPEESDGLKTLSCRTCGGRYKSKAGLQKHRCRPSKQRGVEQDVSGIQLPIKDNSVKSELNYAESTSCSDRDGHSENSVDLEHYDAGKLGTRPTRVSEGVSCQQCGRTYKTNGGLLKHDCVALNQPKKYICDHCGQAYSTKGTLKEHTNIHTRKKLFVCYVCNRTFPHRSSLRYHYTVHTGEKSHTCEVCGKGFSHGSAFKQHVRLHTGDLPYECDRCLRRFNTKANLRNHYYVHTGEYPFECDVCHKGYRKKSDLLAHYEVHSDPVKEAAYLEECAEKAKKSKVCDVCGKVFETPYKMKVHYRVHTGDKPYKCEECGKCFAKTDLLKRHTYIHTQDYPYSCFVCRKGFRDISRLKSHLKSLHGKKSG